MNALATDIDSLFDLEPYEATALMTLEKSTSPGHVAKRIEQHEPVKLQKIIRRLNEGIGVERVADDFGVSRNTVYAIIEKHMGGLTAYRKRLAVEFFQASHQGVQRFKELIGQSKDEVKCAIGTGIMFEKGMMAAGLHTEALDETPLDPKVREDWNDRLRQMRERRAKGRVVEEGSEPINHQLSTLNPPEESAA